MSMRSLHEGHSMSVMLSCLRCDCGNEWLRAMRVYVFGIRFLPPNSEVTRAQDNSAKLLTAGLVFTRRSILFRKRIVNDSVESSVGLGRVLSVSQKLAARLIFGMRISHSRRQEPMWCATTGNALSRADYARASSGIASPSSTILTGRPAKLGIEACL